MIRPLIDVAGPWIADAEARLALKRPGVYAASVLKRTDIQSTAATVDDLFHARPRVASAAAGTTYDRERILRWISNKECATLPVPTGPGGMAAVDAAKQARLADILDEYENAAVNDTRNTQTETAVLRRSWTLPVLKAELGPLFRKLADVKGSGPVLRGLVHFAARFNDPAQYPPGYLESRLRRHANDLKVISYFYPGEKTPRARVTNGLDRLALLVINADVYVDALRQSNPGLQLLGDLSEAKDSSTGSDLSRFNAMQAEVPIAG